MKTTKLMLSSLMVMAILSLSATRATESKVEATAESRCAVSLAAMKTYLETHEHHHTVNYIQYLTNCNGLAEIETGAATVYVENGIIVGHVDPNAG